MINEVELPTGWAQVELNDICHIEMGQSPSSQFYNNNNEGYPLVGGASDFGSQTPESKKHTTDYKKLSSEGDILICIRATIGDLNWSDKTYCLGRGVAGLKAFQNIVPKYIWYSLINAMPYFNANTTGTTFPQVSSITLKKTPLLLPPLNEQNRIVDKIETLFSEVDAGIANLTLAKRQLEQYRQSLLKHAFEGKLTAKWREKHGKALPSADELLEQIQIARQDYYDQQMADWEQAVKSWEDQGKEGVKPRKPSKLDSVTDIDNMENLPTLPDGWRFHRLADIAEVGSGMSVSKNRKVDNPIEVNYLRVANVQRGYLDLDEIKTMIIDKFTFGRYELLEGDILFNEGGDRDKLGRGWIWKNEVDNCITQNHVFRASTHIKNIAHSEFISHWGNTFGRDYFERTGKQTTNLASINKTVLSSFPVPYPSIEEQSLIVKLLNEKTSEVDNLVAELELQLKKATLLKNSILHKAFQGKLVPQDPNDPPASELLAQIKAEREAKALAEKQVKQDKAASKSKVKTKSAKTPKKPKKDEQITLPL